MRKQKMNLKQILFAELSFIQQWYLKIITKWSNNKIRTILEKKSTVTTVGNSEFIIKEYKLVYCSSYLPVDESLSIIPRCDIKALEQDYDVDDQPAGAHGQVQQSLSLTLILQSKDVVGLHAWISYFWRAAWPQHVILSIRTRCAVGLPTKY